TQRQQPQTGQVRHHAEPLQRAAETSGGIRLLRAGSHGSRDTFLHWTGTSIVALITRIELGQIPIVRGELRILLIRGTGRITGTGPRRHRSRSVDRRPYRPARRHPTTRRGPIPLRIPLLRPARTVISPSRRTLPKIGTAHV